MIITDLLDIRGILLNAAPASKTAAINRLVDLMATTGNLTDKAAYKQAVLAREASSTTGIGDGIAIPHAKSCAVTTAGLAAMVVPAGVDYDSLDGQPAHLFFMIAAPDTTTNLHAELLSRLATLLMDTEFKTALLNAKSPEEFRRLIDTTENEKYGKKAQLQAATTKPSSYRVLAVTACPTGIAHNFMAAESLASQAKLLGITIKIETSDTGDPKNHLTDTEIKNAECIIIAADKQVAMQRFNGKPVIQTQVADGINLAEQLLHQAISGTTPIYHSNVATGGDDGIESTKTIDRQVYKHLANGISHILPFVIGGGILLALALLFDTYKTNSANFYYTTSLATFLKTTGETAFAFVLPVLSGYIALSIAPRHGLAIGFIGGMLATTGGSGLIGALLAGFIAGYIVLGLNKAFTVLPPALEGLKQALLYPICGILLIAILITFIINPPVSTINLWLNNNLTCL